MSFAALQGTEGVHHVELSDDGDYVVPAGDAAMVVFWWRGRPVAHRWTSGDTSAPDLPTHGRIEPSVLQPVQAEERAAPAARLDASVVICTRDRPEELRRCLASLPQQSWPPREVIVVDNASRDARTREVALAAGATYVREDRPGLDIARNTGARCATSTIVAYTDDDVRLHPCWLERLVAAFDAPQIAAVTGLVLPAELATDAQCHFERHWSFGRGYLRRDVDAAAFAAVQRDRVFPAWEIGAGASMAFRREVFDRVGGFDERLDVGQAGCSGDSEYWYRLLASGLTCRYEPRSVALHFHRRTIEGLAHQIHLYMRGHAAALLVQHERTGLAVNRQQAWRRKPRWYAGRLWRRLRRGPLPSDRFLRQEILGYLSGLWFYLRHRRESDVSRAAVTARTSIVVAAHDAAATLAQTLDSLLAQTDPDWQAFVVDDGSRDDTPRLIAAYAARDARIVGLRTTDDGACRGASAARNRGLAAAQGRRVLFLDSDDWIDPAHLQTLNTALDAQPDAVAAYCNHRRVMPDGEMAPARRDAQIAAAPMDVFARTCGVAIHAVVAERALVLRAGGFDETLRTCEDWDLWQRVARLGGRWVHVDAALAFYRASEHSLSRDIGRIVLDAAVVIGRGHAQDERLRGQALAHPHGAPDPSGESAATARAYFALWCAAFDCGRGRDGTPLLNDLAALPQGTDHTHAIVATLFDGALVGLRAAPHQLATRWSHYGPQIAALIGAFTQPWSDPVAGRRLHYAFERLVLQCDDLAQPRPLTLTLGLRVDLRRPVDVVLPPGVDRLYVYLCNGPSVLCVHESGALGPVGARQWIEWAFARLGTRKVLRLCAPGVWRTATPERLHAALRDGVCAVRAGRHSGLRWRSVIVEALRRSLCEAAGPALSSSGHGAVLQRLQQAHAPVTPHATPPKAAPPPHRDAGPADSAAYWEALFQTPDPWNYGSQYEQEKYARQLALLPPQPMALAVELACAEGRFTEQLAPRVERLVAADISATALGRAAQRCHGHRNIEFRQLDLARDPLPEGADLIVCSEVLYYLEGEAELARVARCLAAALKPGGRILTAHAFVLKDDLSRTGFDWDNPYGAATIHRTLSAVPQLAVEHSLCTELYRIDCFIRLGDGVAAPSPRVATHPVTAPLEPDVARHVVWGGAIARRANVASERVTRIPVLSYHRVADDGPARLARYRVSPRAFEAQMSWLRRNGYHALVSDELAWFLRERQPFNGRPVMITFDDAYLDFADAAWPVLRRHDLRAEVFVVTDLAGDRALWDRHFGEPARLMPPPEIGGLAAEGVHFGSHLASHRGADGLGTHQLAEELLRSRAALAAWTGRVPLSLAAPFGLTDARLRQLALECGYGLAFGTESAPVELTSERMNLPRVEMRGDMELEEFMAYMAGGR